MLPIEVESTVLPIEVESTRTTGNIMYCTSIYQFPGSYYGNKAAARAHEAPEIQEICVPQTEGQRKCIQTVHLAVNNGKLRESSLELQEKPGQETHQNS